MKTTSSERRALVDKAGKLSVTKQCQLLSISRSSIYYQPAQESDLNLELMKEIDKKYLQHPFMGVPSMTQWLRHDKGYSVNKKRIERLFRIMNISAIVPGPHTSKGNKAHKKYPYLLRNLKITRVNQVWATDITYVPVKNGYLYLIAVIDLYSRYVLSWSISNTMDTQWCIDTVNEAIKRHGTPEIFNTDQGSQFTSDDFTNNIESHKIRVSMDGKGRATDNIFIERLWRSVKYEDIYLNAYENGIELYKGIGNYMEFYNNHRRHQSLDYKRPIDVINAA